MLGRVGKLAGTLEGEKKKVEEQLEKLQLPTAADLSEPAAANGAEDTSEQLEKKEKHLVTINELIDCVQHLENTPDAAKVDQIAEVSHNIDNFLNTSSIKKKVITP